MEEHVFNPFEDRLSRDIRNSLSEGFAQAVETGNDDSLQQTVADLRARSLPAPCLEYLASRYERYNRALGAITGHTRDPLEQAVILWNLGLFFEVHEVLEHVWYDAKGEMKATLQALIRAAGVYIKCEYGFFDSANRIAAKTVPVLEKNSELLRPYFEPEQLITPLKETIDRKSNPPQLVKSP